MEEKEITKTDTQEITKTPDPKQDTGGGGGVDEKTPTVSEP